MLVPNVLMWLASAGAAAWKGTQLVRVPADRGLRLITACVVLVFLALSAQLAATLPGLAERFPAQSPKLLQNALLTLFFALLLVLLHSVSAPGTAVRRGYREVGLALVTSTLLTWSFAVTPVASRGLSYEEALTSNSSAAVAFYALGNAYMAYATVRGSSLAWSAADRTLSRARAGLRVAAAGLVICCLGTHVPRTIATVGALLGSGPTLLGTTTWSTPLLATGISTFFLGIGYPGARSALIKIRLWLLARRRYRRLRPLWSALHSAFPDIALFSPASPAREALQLGDMRLRYYRRYVEIRDGLIRISRYADPGATAPGLAPHEQARQVKAALERRAAGAVPAGAAGTIAPPDADAQRAHDVTALLALSGAMSDSDSG